MKRFLITLALLSVFLRLSAVTQTPYTEVVSFSHTATMPNPGGFPGTTLLSVPGETGTVAVGTAANGTESSIANVALLPGKQYKFTYSGSVTATTPTTTLTYKFSFTAPTGYALYINGVERDLWEGSFSATSATYFSIPDIITLELRPLGDNSAAPAGTFSGIDLGQSVAWSVGLGGLRNGRSAGRIYFRTKDLTNSPVSRDRLYYTPPANDGQIGVRFTGTTTLRQVMTPQAFVDLVDVSGDGYWINIYQPGQVTYTGAATLYTINSGQNPWRTIRVQAPSATQLKITETEGSVSRVSLLALTSGTVSTGAYQWTLKEGDGTTWLRSITHTSTGSPTTTRENVVLVYTGDTTGTVVGKTKYKFAYQAWGAEELTDVLSYPTTSTADANALTTTYTYHTGTTAYGNYRKVKWVTDPTGNWTSYAYYDDWNRRGRLSVLTRPFQDSPATAQAASLTVGDSISYDYVANFSGRYGQESTRMAKTTNVQSGNRTSTITINQSLYLTTTVTKDYASSGASDYLQTTTEVYNPNQPKTDWAGQILSVKRPDQSQDSYAYFRGGYSGTTFTENPAGDYFRTNVWHGTTNSAGATALSTYGSNPASTVTTVYLIANKSTMDVVIQNPAGLVVRKETHVFTGGSSFTLLAAQDFTYDFAGRLTARVASNGATTSSTYANGRLNNTQDEGGVETYYAYDLLGRVSSQRKVGVASSGSYAAQSDVYTYLTYDGANQIRESVTTTATSKPTLPGGALDLFTTADYDLAGRLTEQKQNAGAANTSLRFATSMAYNHASRLTTVTLPGGATKTTENYTDGSLKSVSGTGVVSAGFTYFVDGNGNKAKQSIYGGISSAVNSYQDWLGRPLAEWSIGGDGNWVSKAWSYNSTGQLWKSAQTGVASTLYLYDTLGRLYRQGLDVNGNDVLDLAGDDRITETSVAINPYDGGTTWWLETRGYSYATSGSGAATLTGVSWERLNPGANVLSDTWVNDIYGNRTHSYTTVDRANKKITTTTDTPESTINAVQVAYNGLKVETTDTTGVNMKYGFDALGRLSQSIDPRTGTSSTAYLSGTNLTGTVTDAASIVQATYTYDSAGRVQSVKNALNKYTYYEYTLRNEKSREWGDTAYPIEYVFDALGRQTQMKTYAGSTATFTGSTWPASPGTASTTTWNYHATTGLLSSKTDAAGKSVSFTYTPARQVLKRIWARGVETNYAYSATTAELTGTTYSDGTPAVTYTYNRLGQSSTVADYTGTRTFAYNLGGGLELQYEQLSTFYGTTYPFRVTRGYDTATGTVGRYNSLSVGPSNNPYASYSMSYGYDTSGRLNLSWRFPYTYVANSNLIAGISDLDSNWTQTRTYLSNRDQLDIIETKRGTASKAKFDYAQDNLGRTTAVARTGEMFNRYGNGSQGLDVNYGYNDRSELTSEQTKLGGSATLLTGRNDSYDFDHLGNRKTFTHNGNTATYTTNALNQYSQRTVPGFLELAGAAGAASTVYANGVAPTRQGDFFFQSFQVNNSSARYFNSLFGVTPQTKSLNGIYSFNWQALPVSTPSVTGPTGAAVTALEFGGSPWHVGMDRDAGGWPYGHGYTFQNGRTYSFGFWARTTSGTRTLTPMMTENFNDGITSATMTIDSNWRWVSVTKTFASIGAPRLFYTWDGGGATFQVYGAQVTDITDSAYGGSLPSFIAGTPEVMTYDFDGNLLTDGRFNYYYDAENRLVSVQVASAAVAAGVPQTAVNFQYDYLGRRVVKTNYLWSGGAWVLQAQRRYLYDGWNVLFEFDANMNALTMNVWGLDVSGTLQGAGGVGGLLGSYNFGNGNWYSPAYDGNGNVMAMINRSDGTVAAAYEYDGFGNTIRESGPYAAANPFRSATKYTDTETGLVYYGLRYYSPSLGRFINRDPIEEAGGVNLYGFCANNGVNRYDYLGMDMYEPNNTGGGWFGGVYYPEEAWNKYVQMINQPGYFNGTSSVSGTGSFVAVPDSGGLQAYVSSSWDPSNATLTQQYMFGTGMFAPPPPEKKDLVINSSTHNADGSITYSTNVGDLTVTKVDNTILVSAGETLIGGATVRVLGPNTPHVNEGMSALDYQKFRTVSNAPAFMQDKKLRAQMEKAWEDSNPNAPIVMSDKPGSLKVEQGGWIVEHKTWFGLGKSTFELVRVAPNPVEDPNRRSTLDSIERTTPPSNAVAWFHTHPNLESEGYVPQYFSFSGKNGMHDGDIGYTDDVVKMTGVMRYSGGYVYIYPIKR